MADKFNPKAIIEQMEARYKDLAMRLEGYQLIQEEMTTLSKAIKVMKGEKLGPGGPKGPRKSKQDWAGKIIAASEDDPIRRGVYTDNGAGGARDVAYAFLKKTLKGATIKQIGEALLAQGINGSNSTVHNAIRSFRSELKVVGTDPQSHGGMAQIYAFKKGD